MNKTHRRYRRSLLVTLTCLSLSLLFCAGSAVAWLSKNRKAAGDGMEVQASVGANLVISSSASGIGATNILGGVADPFTATLNVVAGTTTTRQLTAATHTADTTNYPKMLKTLVNTYDLSRSTGNMTSGKQEEYMDVTNGTHYLDYKAYIAAAGAALSNQKLTMEMSVDTTQIIGSSETYKGLSIDVWYKYSNDPNAATYAGTINAAGHDADQHVKSSVTICEGSIPNNELGYIEITLRVYFDGALADESGNTYVRAADLYVSSIPVSVIFKTADKK